MAIHKRVVYLLFAVNKITNLHFRSAVSGPGNISVNAGLQLEMIINTNNFLYHTTVEFTELEGHRELFGRHAM